MKSALFVALLLSILALSSATTQHFTTNNRQIYASWATCDSCNCHSFSLSAFEETTQNQGDVTPVVHLYYSHSVHDTCTNTYKSEWLQKTDSVQGLEISRSGRSAELVTSNMTDSSNQKISLSLNWATADSQNTNNCNCQSVYSYGVESFRISSKSSYRMAQLVGSVTIDNVVHTGSTDSYSYIADYGQKNLILQHK